MKLQNKKNGNENGTGLNTAVTNQLYFFKKSNRASKTNWKWYLNACSLWNITLLQVNWDNQCDSMNIIHTICQGYLEK